MVLYTSDKGTGHVTGEPQLAFPIDVEETGEIRLYRFTLPFTPPSKNEYDGWPGPWQGSCKKKWVKAIIAECEAAMMPKGITKVGLAARLVFPTKNRRDPQNYANCLWNFVPDALVRGGFLVDDREGAVEIGRNWGIAPFAYDLRPGVPKVKRAKTVLTITMRVGDGHV